MLFRVASSAVLSRLCGWNGSNEELSFFFFLTGRDEKGRGKMWVCKEGGCVKGREDRIPVLFILVIRIIIISSGMYRCDVCMIAF